MPAVFASGNIFVTRVLLQRGMAAIYLIAFINVVCQFRPLLGEHGLLPVPEFLRRATFRESPSIFLWRYSDRGAMAVGWMGIALSACALLGLTEAGPLWLSLGAWLVLYILYLSVVNVGQHFYGFGWESMLLEAGFFTAFLGPARMQPSFIPVLILRWMLFRTEMGAGLIKLRHDVCWRDLSCLFYHYETQPLPNRLSWYFHRQPAFAHRFAVLFSHFVQIVVPFGLFAPQPVASLAGGLIIFHQLWLIISGNYSWLNWLTAVLGIAAFSDGVLPLAIRIQTSADPIPFAYRAVLYLLAAGTVILSIQPLLNLFSPHQKMNYSYNRYHLVNAYGAFGSVGKERHEVVIEGTADHVLTPATEWLEYEFKGKPGDPRRTPPQIAPYHLRLDWMIWFIPFSIRVTPSGVMVRGYELWFVRFVKRLLNGDPEMLRLMLTNPFGTQAPAYIRAQVYRYTYTTWSQRRTSGAWWIRELAGTYLQPVSLSDLNV